MKVMKNCVLYWPCEEAIEMKYILFCNYYGNEEMTNYDIVMKQYGEEQCDDCYWW